MSNAWFEVSTGRVEAQPVLIPAPWPAAFRNVLDLLRVVNANALRTYEEITVRPLAEWPEMATWSLAQVLLHRTGIDPAATECSWGLGVSLQRETLVLFGRGRHEVAEVGIRRGLVPMCEWYLAHLPSLDVARAEIADVAATGARQTR